MDPRWRCVSGVGRRGWARRARWPGGQVGSTSASSSAAQQVVAGKMQEDRQLRRMCQARRPRDGKPATDHSSRAQERLGAARLAGRGNLASLTDTPVDTKSGAGHKNSGQYPRRCQSLVMIRRLSFPENPVPLFSFPLSNPRH